MALYLVQHGVSLKKEVDPDQGLTDQGIADVTRIAEVAAGYQVKIAVIKHSGKKRARQTADILSSALRPTQGIVGTAGLKPLDDVRSIAGRINPAENAMFVGHLPFMERLVSYLIIANETPPLFKFQNGGIVCLDTLPETNQWIIKWALMPQIH